MTSNTRISRMTRRFGALIAGTIVAGSVAFAAVPASAATNVSLEVCGQQASTGRVEAHATIVADYYNFTTQKWAATSYRGTTGPGGCGWVTVPSGYYWSLEVFKNPTAGYTYTIAQMCQATGYDYYDDGYTNYQYFPAGSSGGHNLGIASDSTYYVAC